MSTNAKPKVSVILPVFNAEEFLQEAIDSILNQNYIDFELIIINDGSTDKSEEIIISLKDPRVRYIRNDTNIGLVDSLNKGIDLAKGEYIARMDADDISLPLRLEKQISFLDLHPEVGACGTAYCYFGDKEQIEFPPEDYRKAFTFLSNNSSLGHPTAIIRKSVLDQNVIRYENKYQYAADYALWIKIGQSSRIMSLSEPLLRYRWHTSNMSKTDPDRSAARAKARILWHEQILGRSLNELEKNYFENELNDWSTYQVSLNLFLTILKIKNNPFLDKEYFGKLAITEWELKMINQYHLKGLIKCLSKSASRKWSRASNIGLIAYYLRKPIKK